jgi:glycosyltransferase involved in cell wall biosynthesis
MNILFVINQLTCGGAEQQMVTLCEGLRKRDHQITVLSIYDRLELRDRLDRVHVPVTVVKKYSKVDVSVVWRLRQMITRTNPDIVHTYLPASGLFTGMTRWLGVNTPVLQSERSVNNWRSPSRVRLDNLVRRRIANIVCNAEAIRSHLIAAERVDANKITLIYNGLAPERYTRPDEATIASAREQIKAPAGSFIVIAVANFVSEKQHHVMLEAFAQAKKQVDTLFLVLVGKGELERDVRRQIARLELTHSSQLICDCTNPIPFLCASQVGFLTSNIEGCSNALIEAMAMGLPIVVTDAGGNSELVKHREGGIVCRVGDVEALASGLVRLAQDPSLAEAMARYNVTRVQQEFTDDVMVERTLALYRQVLSGRAQHALHNQLDAEPLVAARSRQT